MRILHTMIRVGDLEKSIAFYTEVLGMKLLRRHEYGCDSAGAGRWRGGLGVETEFEMRGEGPSLTTQVK